MSNVKPVIKRINSDVEFRAIGNAFALLIILVGLLAGEALHLMSYHYWYDDIIVLILLVWLTYRLFKNILSTMNVYKNAIIPDLHPAPEREAIQGEEVVSGQIPIKKRIFSPEEVVDQVAKRIEAQKAGIAKKKIENNDF